MTEANPHVLPYRGKPDPKPPLPSFYRTDAFRWVLVCWSVPLGIGLIVALAGACASGLNIESADQAWGFGWVMTMMIGLLATLSGLAVIVATVVSRWPQSALRGNEVVWPAVASVALLASNLVMAFGMTMIILGREVG